MIVNADAGAAPATINASAAARQCIVITRPSLNMLNHIPTMATREVSIDAPVAARHAQPWPAR
ncbi:hypothetical protein GCM10007973_18580 [Polymorphobacter multimanifer]|nr:hypothetical protein GCM10007973_18580 [Polymorphobacter multimanifer]